MKLRPILFSKSMVQAILADRKCQTRRAAKGIPDDCHLATADDWNEVRADPRMRPFEAFGPARGMAPVRYADGGIAAYTCPFGAPGDHLWCREAWRVSQAHDALPPRDIPTDVTAEYVADGTGYFDGRYRHARFMPRWASRLTLEITAVRLERLNDISESDALAEGVPTGDDFPIEGGYPCPRCKGDGTREALGANYGVTYVDCSECDTPVKRYRLLWNSINGDDAWDSNPWVWTVAFRRVREIAVERAA